MYYHFVVGWVLIMGMEAGRGGVGVGSRGWGPKLLLPVPCIAASRSLFKIPYFLGFLLVADRLQNVKHFCVISSCFSLYPPIENLHLSPFPLLPRVPLRPPTFPKSHLLSFPTISEIFLVIFFRISMFDYQVQLSDHAASAYSFSDDYDDFEGDAALFQ